MDDFCSECNKPLTYRHDEEMPHLVHHEDCNYVGHLYSHLELDDQDKEMECICEDDVVLVYHADCCTYCIELGYNEYTNFEYLAEKEETNG